MKKRFNIFLYMAILGVAMSFSTKRNKDEDFRLRILFKHAVGEEMLKLDTVNYRNSIGQTFTVSKFKYYLSNFHFKTIEGKDFYLDECFLIDEEDAASKEISIKKIPYGNYILLDFIIGVDSLHNCSGAQSGALDPANAMFWAWNTGYIFLKLEGTSAFSKSPAHFFEYHIGGYKLPYNQIRKISLGFEKERLKIEPSEKQTLTVKVDVLEILKTPNVVDFEKLSVITDAKNAGIIADNYSNMFEIVPKLRAK